MRAGVGGTLFFNDGSVSIVVGRGHRGGLPVVFNFVNNFYGMGGQPEGETMGFGTLARLGAGVNRAQMHAERMRRV